MARERRPSLGVLFVLIAAGFAGIAVVAGLAGGTAWVVAAASGALALWMADLAIRAFR
ncbi:MAG: hypothetical protein M3327_05565 [Actinomycetota bacterium]|nr:hypothetical protein [Actinomycetota bacterium]